MKLNQRWFEAVIVKTNETGWYLLLIILHIVEFRTLVKEIYILVGLIRLSKKIKSVHANVLNNKEMSINLHRSNFICYM